MHLYMYICMYMYAYTDIDMIYTHVFLYLFDLTYYNQTGTFTDDKVTRKLQLTCEDHSMYSNWEFISKRSFQEEVVEYLVIEEKQVKLCGYMFLHGYMRINEYVHTVLNIYLINFRSIIGSHCNLLPK